MARNNNKMTKRHKMPKIEPAVLQMEFQVPEGQSYIDMALAMSIVNRRAYKQASTKYTVSSFEFLGSGASSGIVAVGKIPETWVYQAAYDKTHRLFDEMNDQVLDTEPSIQGRYHDFKVAMNSDMQLQTIQSAANPTGKILTPLNAGVAGTGVEFTQATYDETGVIRANWDSSILTIPNDPAPGVTAEYLLHACGPATTTSKGIIEGYALSRSRPQTQDPNVPTVGGWMNDLFDDGDQLDELRDNIQEENDRPPYAVTQQGSATESYPGGSTESPGLQVHGFASFGLTTVSSKNVISGGIFLNGLLQLNNNTGNTLSLLLHLVPGFTRGYLTEEF